LIYSITCSMYDYLAQIEVLRVVVSVLHLRVILQYRSSDSTQMSKWLLSYVTDGLGDMYLWTSLLVAVPCIFWDCMRCAMCIS